MDREAWHAAVHGVAESCTRLSDWTEMKPVSRRGEEELSSSPSWIVDSGDVEEHSPETTSFSFSSDVTKNKELVSIILKWPTVHPIQTNHLFPVQIYLQALRRFFPFSFYFSPYSLSPLSQQANGANQKTKPTTRSSPCGFSRGKDFPGLSCLHLLRTSSYLITQTYIGVPLHTETGVFCFFFFFQFVVSFSFLQKMQTKEKQGFQLKVHLFFNMKTLIELVGSPMQWSARSFGNWHNIWSLRSWGLFEETSLHKSWAKGDGCAGRERARGEEDKRRKEKNVIGEEENGKLLLFLPSTSFPFFLPVDDSSPPRVRAEFTLGVFDAYCFVFTSTEHHLYVFLCLHIWFPTAP